MQAPPSAAAAGSGGGRPPNAQPRRANASPPSARRRGDASHPTHPRGSARLDDERVWELRRHHPRVGHRPRLLGAEEAVRLQLVAGARFELWKRTLTFEFFLTY